jgi:hypothetical protein
MHLRAAVTLWLVAVALLSLPSTCDAKRKKKRTKAPAKKAPVRVNLTELEICEGCYTYVEQYWKLMHTLKYQLAHEANKKGGKKHVDINGDQWAKKLCRTNLYDSFTLETTYACHHMKDNYWEQVVVPMREALSMSQVDVLYKKREICKEHVCGNVKVLIDKVEKSHAKRSECHACKAIGHDLDFVLRREKQTTDGERMQRLLEGLCKDLALRHFKPSKIEELCEIMLEDFGDHIVGEKGQHWLDKNYYVLPKPMTDVIEKVTEEAAKNTTLAKRKLYDDINAGRVALEKHLCTSLTSYCPATAWDGELPKPLTEEEKEAAARMDAARKKEKTQSFSIPVDTAGVGGKEAGSFTINPGEELKKTEDKKERGGGGGQRRRTQRRQKGKQRKEGQRRSRQRMQRMQQKRQQRRRPQKRQAQGRRARRAKRARRAVRRCTLRTQNLYRMGRRSSCSKRSSCSRRSFTTARSAADSAAAGRSKPKSKSLREETRKGGGSWQLPRRGF